MLTGWSGLAPCPPLRCVQFQGLGFRQGGLLGDSLDAKLVLKIGDDLLF